jgi:uncharacterized protein
LTGAVAHFEIYAEEPAKLADFYRGVFEWRLDKAPGVDYWRIQTGSAAATSFNGGLTYRPIAGTRGWMHYVHVASLDDAVAAAERLGAAVLRPSSVRRSSAAGTPSSPTPRVTPSPSAAGRERDAGAGTRVTPERRWRGKQDDYGQGLIGAP